MYMPATVFFNLPPDVEHFNIEVQLWRWGFDSRRARGRPFGPLFHALKQQTLPQITHTAQLQEFPAGP